MYIKVNTKVDYPCVFLDKTKPSSKTKSKISAYEKCIFTLNILRIIFHLNVIKYGDAINILTDGMFIKLLSPEHSTQIIPFLTNVSSFHILLSWYSARPIDNSYIPLYHIQWSTVWEREMNRNNEKKGTNESTTTTSEYVLLLSI